MSSRILIFDNDGTLVPSHLVANPAIQEAFARFSEERRLGLPAPSDARIRELTGQPGDAFYRALLPERLQHLAAELRNFCLDREVAEMRRAATFYPGIEEMLHACRARGDRLVLASHGGERYIGAVAERLRYADLFDRVYHHGFEGMQEKTEMARRARSELGPGRPAVFAGDRRADLLAARAAGTRFVGCLYGYGSREELEGADALAATPAGLAAILLNGEEAEGPGVRPGEDPAISEGGA